METVITPSYFDAPVTRDDESTTPRDKVHAPVPRWPLWQRMLFRFFATYFLLQIAPWNWFRVVPGVSWVINYYDIAEDWAIRTANAQLFHVRETLVMMNGSGDTSYAYAQLCLFLLIATVATLVWSIVDSRRQHYDRAAFWLRQIVRYYIAMAALSYGIIKIFALQMPFPTLSQLATPLGDLLPMRLSWLFIGYSEPYQMFSGVMETAAGLLLLYRRTITAGLLVAAAAFANVVMINLSYDVPVKLYSSHLFLACVFLLALDYRRLLNFFVLERPATATDAYRFRFRSTTRRILAIATKVFLVYQILWLPLQRGHQRYTMLQQPAPSGPLRTGVYDVRLFVVNGDTIPAHADSLRWSDVIFDSNNAGSIGTADSTFWRRYGRGYFRYRADTATGVASVWKTSTIPRDSTYLFDMRFETPDTNVIRLFASIRGDTVHAELVRKPRHFQLTERQFHWLSEYNR